MRKWKQAVGTNDPNQGKWVDEDEVSTRDQTFTADKVKGAQVKPSPSPAPAKPGGATAGSQVKALESRPPMPQQKDFNTLGQWTNAVREWRDKYGR